jgi:hypothetical protein
MKCFTNGNLLVSKVVFSYLPRRGYLFVETTTLNLHCPVGATHFNR